MRGLEYRLIGAYDSETTNYISKSGQKRAFPILHQLGILDTTIDRITADNVKAHTTIELYRHSVDLFARLDELSEIDHGFVPVLACHNLSFDIQALSYYLDQRRDNVRVLAKSCRKPISITITDDSNNPRLVIWDTLQFSMKGLSRMGNECGFPKLVGSWDYDLIRTPETPLTVNEIEYAKHDIYTLLAWLGYWTAKNPDIDYTRLGLNIVTKTGVVREKRRVRFYKAKGIRHKHNAGEYWYLHNKANRPKTDDELFTMVACTRGGFTFTANSAAHKVYDLDTSRAVFGFDAASMHPAQMVSHRYPVKFHSASCEALQIAFDLIRDTSLDDVLCNWAKPFNTAILGCYEFTNLRPKHGSIYERFGIFPLASARFRSVREFELNTDNQDSQEFTADMEKRGYKDQAVNPHYAFGKLVSCDSCRLYVTELTLWEMSRCYEWDSVKAIHGYITGRFERAADYSVISVMQFYKAKNEFKKAMREYAQKATITNGETLFALGIPEFLVKQLQDGTASYDDINLTYKGLKADLNSLFGIEATNEYRRDTIIDDAGIAYTGEFGICNAPRTSKACYQFGQRIVGWSRIVQICVMELIAPYVVQIINGDTDSIKVLACQNDLPVIQSRMLMFGQYLDRAKVDCCTRVKCGYPSLFDSLDGIGHYELEFIARQFCALWNKAYIVGNETGYHITMAGVPTKGLEDMLSGEPFDYVCNKVLGYNCTISPDLTNLTQHSIPEWATLFNETITDYLGKTAHVCEPASICIYPMAKTIGDTDKPENARNADIAISNNASVDLTPRLVYGKGIRYFDD